MVTDTERVCARRDAASYSQLPLSTATSHDLADRRTPVVSVQNAIYETSRSFT